MTPWASDSALSLSLYLSLSLFVPMCVHSCRSQRLTSGDSLTCSPLRFLRSNLPLNLELTDLLRLTFSLSTCTGSTDSYTLPHASGFCVGTRDSSSGSYASTAVWCWPSHLPVLILYFSCVHHFQSWIDRISVGPGSTSQPYWWYPALCISRQTQNQV